MRMTGPGDGLATSHKSRTALSLMQAKPEAAMKGGIMARRTVAAEIIHRKDRLSAAWPTSALFEQGLINRGRLKWGMQ